MTTRRSWGASVGLMLGLGLLGAASATAAQERTQLEAFVTGFPAELASRTRDASLPRLLSGGDEAAYFNMRASEFLPTAILPVRQPVMPLATAIEPRIGEISAETMNFGEMTLDEYLALPESYVQSFIVIHDGRIVFEAYPRMRPEDHHLWMSNAKVTASLVIDLLIEEGRIDENETLGTYIPEFVGTPTGDVTVRDALDMTTGLNSDENPETRADPNSIAIRTFNAEFGMPHDGAPERLIDVLKDAEPVREAGEAFQYASATTQLLVYLAEAVEGKRWPDTFDERVWSKIGAEAPFQVHLTPDGVAIAHGLVSSNLRDLARFGMLYTPSWTEIATEQVVSDAMIRRIRESVRSTDFFLGGYNGPAFQAIFDDDTMLSNSRQWDIVWPDGDMWKGGLMTQGLYVSPDRDLVIAYFSVNVGDRSIDRFLRPIATSDLLNGGD
ncbi:serine hydrolase domain-containing protein [Amaricoccus macauensis]|uniref:serine hydrolase domain-containing protein n=1 Tax=Amaricoccus macauensis TaxID=57001 RepID=UPI003C7E1D0A